MIPGLERLKYHDCEFEVSPGTVVLPQRMTETRTKDFSICPSLLSFHSCDQHLIQQQLRKKDFISLYTLHITVDHLRKSAKELKTGPKAETWGNVAY